jgi:hypothetical protein
LRSQTLGLFLGVIVGAVYMNKSMNQAYETTKSKCVPLLLLFVHP